MAVTKGFRRAKRAVCMLVPMMRNGTVAMVVALVAMGADGERFCQVSSRRCGI